MAASAENVVVDLPVEGSGDESGVDDGDPEERLAALQAEAEANARAELEALGLSDSDVS